MENDNAKWMELVLDCNHCKYRENEKECKKTFRMGMCPITSIPSKE